jgi:hypothetical protein
LGAIKPKGLNRIAKIDNGHLCLREFYRDIYIYHEDGQSVSGQVETD